jgi:hypothetical protein
MARDLQTELANKAAGNAGENYCKQAYGFILSTDDYDIKGDGTTRSQKGMEIKHQWPNTIFKDEGPLLSYSAGEASKGFVNANKCLNVEILLWVVAFPCGIVKTYFMPKGKRKGFKYTVKGKRMIGCYLKDAIEVIGKIDSAPDGLDKQLWSDYELNNTSGLYEKDKKDGKAEKIILEITESLPKINYADL